YVGLEQSRRSFIQALGICLFYLHKGRLPWQGVLADTLEQKLVLTGTMKKAFRSEAPLFSAWFDHCCGLSFHGSPGYDYLTGLHSPYLAIDELFNWMKLNDG
ncbi:hypothetical protein B0H13DRAFT_1491549, partial [Mycena leptocephala]